MTYEDWKKEERKRTNYLKLIRNLRERPTARPDIKESTAGADQKTEKREKEKENY